VMQTIVNHAVVTGESDCIPSLIAFAGGMLRSLLPCASLTATCTSLLSATCRTIY